MVVFSEQPQSLVLSTGQSTVVIDRASGKLSRVEPEKAAASTNGREIVGVLGIIELPQSKYVVLATSSARAGDIGGKPVYKITHTEIVPLAAHSGIGRRDGEYLSLLRSHLSRATLYYSPTHDLTSSTQRTALRVRAGESPLVDDRFLWNFEIARDLFAFPEFVLPVIYGVFSMTRVQVNGQSIEFGVISRRSRFRAGTRYFRRGLDSDGYAANFNETEQIVVAGDRLFSFLQTRGSVPALWGEVNTLKYKPKLRIGDLSASVAAAGKHFADQKERYGEPQYLVNLVNQTGYEKPVKEVYEAVVRELRDPALRYVFFDFHHECSHMRWDRVQLLVDELVAQGFDEAGWFEAQRGQIVRLQDGVVRTNCMDCLDRTNVVQSTLAMHMLRRQLQEAGVVQGADDLARDAVFVSHFRNVWADNADGVSVAYSGTGALKTDFTRTGKRTKKGALQDLQNSIVRYYRNNLRDGPRQDGYSLFLGDYVPSNKDPFVDRRSLWIQSVPYALSGAFLVFVLSVVYPSQDHSKLFNTLVSLGFLTAATVSLKFIFDHGLQYVNWPKLTNVEFVEWTRNGYAVQGEHSSKED